MFTTEDKTKVQELIKQKGGFRNFISYYGCVHVGQANLTGEALYHLDLSKAKQVEKQE